MKPLQCPLGFCHVVQCDEPAVGTHGGFAAFCKAHLVNPDAPCVPKVAGSAGLHDWVASHSPPPPERPPRCRTKNPTATPVAGAAWPSSTSSLPIDASTVEADSSAAPPIGTTAEVLPDPTPSISSLPSSVSDTPSDPEPEPTPTTDSKPFEAASTSPSTIDPEAPMPRKPTLKDLTRALTTRGGGASRADLMKDLGITSTHLFRGLADAALAAELVVRTGQTSQVRYYLRAACAPETPSSPSEAKQAAAPSLCVAPDASAFPDGVPGVAIPDDPSHPRLDPAAPADDFTTAVADEYVLSKASVAELGDLVENANRGVSELLQLLGASSAAQAIGMLNNLDSDLRSEGLLIADTGCAGPTCASIHLTARVNAALDRLRNSIARAEKSEAFNVAVSMELVELKLAARSGAISEKDAQRLYALGYREGAGDKTTWLLNLVEKQRRDFYDERALRRLAESWQLGAKGIPLPDSEVLSPAMWEAGRTWRELSTRTNSEPTELQQLRASLLTTLRSTGVHLVENVSATGLYGALCESIYYRVLLANQLGHVRNQVQLLRATGEASTRELALLNIEAALGLPLGGRSN